MYKIHIQGVKSKAPSIFLLKQFSIYREEILLNIATFYLLWNYALISKGKYSKIQVIAGFDYKVMSFSNLSKCLAIAPKLQEETPNI